MPNLYPVAVPRSLRLFAAAASAALLSTVVGCAGFVATATDTSPLPAVTSVHGSVHGGQQPVTGSRIYLYTVGTGGYGTAATSILTAQTGATQDTNGNYYVTTDSSGNFAFTTFNCGTKVSVQTYILALGGNPGLGGTVNNSAISAISPAGKCNAIGTNSFFAINELTTVAFVTTMQQYMADATHVAAIGNLPQGVKIANNLAGDLVNPASGVANTTNGTGTGIIPTAKVNALGNVLAPCLNSSDPSSSACTSLFAAVTPSGGTAPTDIVGAMLLIAQNPGNNVAAIFGQATATPPFQPTISASTPPNDLTLAITYSGGGMTAPGLVVIDALGDAFIGNSPSTAGASGTDSIVGFGPDGTILTGATGFTNGIHAPTGLAIDGQGDIWSNNAATSTQSDAVVRMTSAGAFTNNNFPLTNAKLNGLQGIAIDSGNNAWVVSQNLSTIVKVNVGGTISLAPVSAGAQNFPTGIGIDGTGILFAALTANNTILKFNSSGTILSPANGYTSAQLMQPTNISIDAADHVFTINNAPSNSSNAITELNGADGSTVTPYVPQPTLANAYVLAIDGLGGQWYANCRAACGAATSSPDNLVRVAVNGSQNTGTADGFQDSNLSRVGTAAIDGSGNVWVTNNGNGTVSEFLGIAPPVVTPLAVAVSTNKLGTRP